MTLKVEEVQHLISSLGNGEIKFSVVLGPWHCHRNGCQFFSFNSFLFDNNVNVCNNTLGTDQKLFFEISTHLPQHHPYDNTCVKKLL